MNLDIVSRAGAVLSAGQAVGWATVSPGYFEVLKIPVKRGRTFSSGDDSKSPAVVVINERMAQQYWKDGDPLGQRIAIGRGDWMKEFKDEPVLQGMSLALAGVVAGLAAAWGLARLIANFLFGVRVHDLTVFVAVPVVLCVVALVAVYAPANPASRVNPIDSLRYE